MEKHILNDLVNENLSIQEISTRTGKSKTSIRHWLKKYELKTAWSLQEKKQIKIGDTKMCYRCNTVKPVDDFYRRRNNSEPSSYCKPCSIINTIERQRLFKKQCIEYKGGKCERCSYNKCDAAMEFHHIDPSQKDFSISHIKLTKFCNKAKKELDKCILLCSNCHREVHFELSEIKNNLR